MDDKIKDALGVIQADQRLKRMTKARIRSATFDYGRAMARIQARRRRVAALAASAVLCIGGAGLWFRPVKCIGLDINPSVEIRVNALDRVIALEGLNPDGEKLAAALDVAGMDYGDAMGRIMVSDELGGYLDAGNLLSITVSGRGAEQTLKQVVCRAYAVAEDEQVFYILADDATVRAAKAEGLSVVQYEALTALRQSDPGEEARIIGYDAQTDFILTPYLPDEHKEGITAEEMIVGHNFADDDLVGRFNALAKERKKEIGLLRAIGLRKGQVFGLIIGETCTMALMGGILGSVIALLCMDPVIEMLREAFKLSPSVWSAQLALLCGAAGVVLAAALGFAAAVAPAAKSASMDPQAAITQGEVN